MPIDAELIRAYSGYMRADIPGLKAGSYSLKVVAIKGGVETLFSEVTALQVKNYSREGFAHKDAVKQYFVTAQRAYLLEGNDKMALDLERFINETFPA